MKRVALNIFSNGFQMFCTGIILCFFFSCGDSEDRVGGNDAMHAPEASLPEFNSVDVNLPMAEGEELFKANCMTCHTLRYIQMQPDFPRKTWEGIVNKMVKSFGAPISDSSAKVIVNYLVTIKGK